MAFRDDNDMLVMVTPFPPNREGLSEYSLNLIKHIKSYFRRYLILSFKEKAINNSAIEKNVVRVFLPGSAKVIDSILLIPGYIRGLALLLRSKARIIHFQFGFTRYFGGFIGEPFVMLIKALNILKKNTKIIVTLHTVWSEESLIQRLGELYKGGIISRIAYKVFKYYYNIIERLLIRSVDVIVLPTATFPIDLVEYLRSKYPGILVIEIPHGVYDIIDSNEYIRDDIRHILSYLYKEKKKGRIILLLFGAIRRGKGYEKILQVLGNYDKETLRKKLLVVIAGYVPGTEDYDYYQMLREIILRNNLKEIVVMIPTYLTISEVAQLHKLADVVLLSYTRALGPSGALMWALAKEVTPIIVTRSPSGDLPAIYASSLEEAINEVLELAENPERASRIRSELRKYKLLYSFKNVARLHVRLYKYVLGLNAR